MTNIQIQKEFDKIVKNKFDQQNIHKYDFGVNQKQNQPGRITYTWDNVSYLNTKI